MHSQACIHLPRALRDRQFALLWTGQTISRLGDNIFIIAVNVWLVEKTGSAEVIAVTLLSSLVPTLIFGILGGAIADRMPRARIVAAADAFCAGAVGAISALAFTNHLEIWAISACNLLFGFAEAFHQPAYRALIPELLSADVRNSASSITVVGERITAMIGPMIGTVLITKFGHSMAFAVNGMSYLVAAACMLPIRSTSHSNKGQLRTLGRREVTEGLVTIGSRPLLWITISLFAVINVTFFGPILVALPLLAHARFDPSGGALGLLYSASACGSIVVAFAFERIRKVRRRGPVIYFSAVLIGLAVTTIGLPLALVCLVVGMFVLGAGSSTCNLVWFNTICEIVPPEKLGRVMSLDHLGSRILLPVGILLSGVLTDHLSASVTFVLGGSVTVVLVLVCLTHPGVRNFD